MSNANDMYESYFAEKIWEMIPSIYRHEDGLAKNPNVLRSFVEIIARQAAVLRRSSDRLWEDQFIDFCDDWVIPYLGDLIATRLITDQNKRGLRVDVAKTIYYRRRKGTIRVLEELVSDITDWEGKVVESFKKLGRTRHRLDPKPLALAGLFSGTMPGGWADLRRQLSTELTSSPFDEFFHTPDIRRHHGQFGRYGIPKLTFYLYRLSSFKVSGVTPKQITAKKFTFDPSGRDIPLFMPRRRQNNYNWEEWQSAVEWQLPAPIRCRLLGHAEYSIGVSTINTLINDAGISPEAANELCTLIGRNFKNEHYLKAVLSTLPHSAELLNTAVFEKILELGLITDCGKNMLLPNVIRIEDAPGNEIQKEKVTAGSLLYWSVPVSDKRAVIDPERGRLLFIGDSPSNGKNVDYYYGSAGEIGSGTYPRRHVEKNTPASEISGQGNQAIAASDMRNDGITQINNSSTYSPIASKNAIKKMTFQAANHQRPYLLLQSNWNLTGSSEDAELTLDGLWIGSESGNRIILRGMFKKVTIRHCTFDPGGEDVEGNPIHPVHLEIKANIDELIIESSIISSVKSVGDGIIKKCIVKDSIIHSANPAESAIELTKGEVNIEQVTVFGKVQIHRLKLATNSIFTDMVNINDTQFGCFRFSAAPKGSTLTLPRPYNAYWIEDINHLFTSSRFGDPGYGQLSDIAPIELRSGAENGLEMGAFCNRINPVKMKSLQTKIHEYMPFGLIPIFINET